MYQKIFYLCEKSGASLNKNAHEMHIKNKIKNLIHNKNWMYVFFSFDSNDDKRHSEYFVCNSCVVLMMTSDIIKNYKNIKIYNIFFKNIFMFILAINNLDSRHSDFSCCK